MMEILGYQFFQNALLVSFLASVAAGVMGTYIVVKRMSLITGSIGHTAFGGLGISYYLGMNPLLGAMAFSLLSASAVSFFRKKAQNRMDILLSFLWATGMAIGLVFMFLTPGYGSDLFTYLFGNILLVSSFDLTLIVILDVLILVTVYLMYNSFLAVVFDEEYAEVRNMPVRFVYLVLLCLIALTVITIIRLVGIVLMIALLTMPAATAQIISRNVGRMMIVASLITLFSTISGLLISYFLDFATGPIIVLIISLVYLIGVFYGQLKK